MKGNCTIGTESCVSASDKSGTWDRIAVYSIELVESSLLYNPASKNSIQNSHFNNIIIPNMYIAPKNINLSEKNGKYEQHSYFQKTLIV